MRRPPDDNRDRFRFIEVTEKSFSFLIPLGFEIRQRGALLMRFENPAVFVDVYRDPLSYHVGLDLGRLREGDSYSLHEVISFVAPTERALDRCQATTPEVIERCLSAIAEIVNKECRLLLAGDSAAFESLRSAVAPIRKKLTFESQFGAIIDRADRAWEAKDLPLAMTLYQNAEPGLDRSRQGRLAYLRKKAP